MIRLVLDSIWITYWVSTSGLVLFLEQFVLVLDKLERTSTVRYNFYHLHAQTYGARFLELLLSGFELLLELYVLLVEDQKFGFGLFRQFFASQTRSQIPTRAKQPE